MKRAGWLALGSWVLVTGAIDLIDLSFKGSSTIMAIWGLTAGVLVLLAHLNPKKRLGPMLLAIWLVTTSLCQLLQISFKGDHTVFAILGLVAGLVFLINPPK